jgi:hypothetical protein
MERQSLGDNAATWGAPKLNDVFDRLDEAIAGVEAISTSGGTTTLTSNNYSTDQARKAVLVLSGTLASNAVIIVPNVEKTYLAVNNTTGSFSVTVKTAAGTGYALRSGPNWVYCDATNVVGAVPRLDQAPLATASVDVNSQRITNLGTPSASTDAATKAYVDAAVSTTPTQNLATSAGTALAPTYSWATDSNTGMYLVGSDSLGLSAGGTVRATVSSTGLAVAGVFSASGAMTASGGLGVTGALTTSGGASIGATLGVTGAATFGSTASVTGALTAASVASSGAVSGTTLSASGAATLSSTLAVSGTTTLTVLNTNLGSAASPTHGFSSDTNTGMYAGGSDILRLATGGVDRLAIDASGNVGVGYTTPPAATDHRLLVLKGPASGEGTASVRVEGGTTTKRAIFQVAGSAGDVAVGTDVTTNTTGALGLFAGGALRANIDSSGYLKFGQNTTTTPGYSGDTTLGSALWPDGRIFASAASFSSMNLNADGAVLLLNRSGTNVGNISVSTTAATYNTSSDYRLKTDVEPLTGALARLSGLKPSRFRFKSDPTGKFDGFIAHEVSPIVPEAVTGEKDGDLMQGLDAGKIVPLLVAAVQELAARVEALENA